MNHLEQTFRRNPDGSIDFAFYRAYATVLRRQARQEALQVSLQLPPGLKVAIGAVTTIAMAIAVVTSIPGHVL
jgi:hypothetical protein